jgi:hypothetical protein
LNGSLTVRNRLSTPATLTPPGGFAKLHLRESISLGALCQCGTQSMDSSLPEAK